MNFLLGMYLGMVWDVCVLFLVIKMHDVLSCAVISFTSVLYFTLKSRWVDNWEVCEADLAGNFCVLSYGI